MKIGNISQTVLKRSVLKQITHTREEVFMKPTVEEMCMGLRTDHKDAVISCSTTIFGDEKDLGVYGIAKVTNDIASRGAEPIAIDVIIQLPPHAYESRLKAMVACMEACCHRINIQIGRISANVNPIISSAIIYIAGLGLIEEKNVVRTVHGQANKDIVLLNTVGQEGVLRVLFKKQEELEARFIPSFFDKMVKDKDGLFVKDMIHLAIDNGACAVHQISEGGILAALWELGEAANIGLELDIKKMEIKQETIEICEFIGLNPYQLSSIGSVLIITEDGTDLVREIQNRGYSAEIIGRTTSGNDRIILNGGEKRFLDRPVPDELLKLYQKQGEQHD